MSTPLHPATRGRFVLTEVAVPGMLGAHPALVLEQRPTVPDLVEAAAVIGAFPDGSYLSGEIRVSLLTLGGPW